MTIIETADYIVDLACEIHGKHDARLSFDQALRLAEDLYLSIVIETDEPPEFGPFTTFQDT